MVKNIKPDIEVGTTACKEIVASDKLAKVLQIVLSVGNFMNSGSGNGQANGFELPILAKLNEIKSTDNKKTLFDFLVETIDKKFPELLSFDDEIINSSEATRINVNNIIDTIEQIAESSKSLEEELEYKHEYDSECQTAGDKFVEVMTRFLLHCRNKLQLLKEAMDQMQNCYQEVGKYFAFNVDKYPLEECFSDIKIFKDLFTQKHKEMLKMHNTNGAAHQFTNVHPTVQQEQEVAIPDTGKVFSYGRISYIA